MSAAETFLCTLYIKICGKISVCEFGDALLVMPALYPIYFNSQLFKAFVCPPLALPRMFALVHVVQALLKLQASVVDR